MTDRAQRHHAIHRIHMRRQLWLHFVSWVGFAALMVAAWHRSGADFFWPIWPLAGWGIGLFAHASHVLASSTAVSEHRIARELARMR